MPKLEQLDGSYGHSLIVQPLGFQMNGSSAPTVLRDGTNVSTASGKMFTVSRVSAGLFTISLDSKTPWPERPFVFVEACQAAPPTTPVYAEYVRNSYSASARTFQVQVLTVAGTPAASDGDAGDRVSILLVGSNTSVGTDPA